MGYWRKRERERERGGEGRERGRENERERERGREGGRGITQSHDVTAIAASVAMPALHKIR